MTIRPLHGWILGLSAVVVFFGTLAYTGNFSSTENQAVAFVTVGLDQTKLPNESSSYEIERAVEHFSDVILGWTVEPSFAKDFAQGVGEGYSFSGQRQEKQNLIFTVTGPVETEGPAITLVSLIRARLEQHNSVTQAGFVIALERETLVEVTRSNWRMAAGVTLLVLVLEGLTLLAFDYARRR